MNEFPWFAWIPLLGITGWIIVTTAGILTGTSRRARVQLTAALRESTAVNHQLAERLEHMERRLAAIERTLTDIN